MDVRVVDIGRIVENQCCKFHMKSLKIPKGQSDTGSYIIRWSLAVVRVGD